VRSWILTGTRSREGWRAEKKIPEIFPASTMETTEQVE
jgi:hypothetical protein